MDINCLTSFCLFYPDGVLLHGCVTGDVLLDAFFFRAFLSRAFLSRAFLLDVLLGVLLDVLLDGGETRRGALSAIWGLVISSLNPKHRFLHFRYRLFHHRCRLLVRFIEAIIFNIPIQVTSNEKKKKKKTISLCKLTY